MDLVQMQKSLQDYTKSLFLEVSFFTFLKGIKIRNYLLEKKILKGYYVFVNMILKVEKGFRFHKIKQKKP